MNHQFYKLLTIIINYNYVLIIKAENIYMNVML